MTEMEMALLVSAGVLAWDYSSETSTELTEKGMDFMEQVRHASSPEIALQAYALALLHVHSHLEALHRCVAVAAGDDSDQARALAVVKEKIDKVIDSIWGRARQFPAALHRAQDLEQECRDAPLH